MLTVVQCEEPQGPFGSSHVLSNNYVAGSTVTFTCDQSGFVLDPPIGILTCDGVNGWSADQTLSGLKCVGKYGNYVCN